MRCKWPYLYDQWWLLYSAIYYRGVAKDELCFKMYIKEHKMVFIAFLVVIVIVFSLSQMNLDVYVFNAFKTKATNTAESGNYLISGKGTFIKQFILNKMIQYYDNLHLAAINI